MADEMAKEQVFPRCHARRWAQLEKRASRRSTERSSHIIGDEQLTSTLRDQNETRRIGDRLLAKNHQRGTYGRWRDLSLIERSTAIGTLSDDFYDLLLNADVLWGPLLAPAR